MYASSRPSNLLFKFDQAERTVVEDADLDWQLLLHGGEQVAQQHTKTPISGKRDDLSPRIGGLGAECLRHGVGHGAVAEAHYRPVGSSRRHVAQAPDLRRPSVGRVDGVFGKWFITSADVGPVSAIDEKSAQLMIGKTAYFDAKFVQFGEH